jgi:hypothetical protein
MKGDVVMKRMWKTKPDDITGKYVQGYDLEKEIRPIRNIIIKPVSHFPLEKYSRMFVFLRDADDMYLDVTTKATWLPFAFQDQNHSFTVRK